MAKRFDWKSLISGLQTKRVITELEIDYDMRNVSVSAEQWTNSNAAHSSDVQHSLKRNRIFLFSACKKLCFPQVYVAVRRQKAIRSSNKQQKISPMSDFLMVTNIIAIYNKQNADCVLFEKITERLSSKIAYSQMYLRWWQYWYDQLTLRSY